MKAPKIASKAAANGSKTATTITNALKTSSPPSWPALPSSEQRSHELEIEEVLSSQILLIHGFFPSKACATWLSFLSDPQNIPLQATPPAKKGEAARTNHRFSVTDAAFAQRLWSETGLEKVVTATSNAETFTSSEKPGSRPVGLNPNMRVCLPTIGSLAADESLTLLFALRYIATSLVRAFHRTMMTASTSAESIQNGHF